MTDSEVNNKVQELIETQNVAEIFGKVIGFAKQILLDGIAQESSS